MGNLLGSCVGVHRRPRLERLGLAFRLALGLFDRRLAPLGGGRNGGGTRGAATEAAGATAATGAAGATGRGGGGRDGGRGRDVGGGLWRLASFGPLQPGRDQGDEDVVAERLAQARPEDDVRVRVGMLADLVGRLPDLAQAEIGRAGDVEEDPASSLDARFEERARDRLASRISARGARRCPVPSR